MSILTGYLPVALDSEGRTLPNAKMYSYLVGTYTLKDTYSNVGLTVPNSNPIVADGSGVFTSVYLGSGGYRLELRDENNVVIEDQDNYYSNLTGADLANIDAAIDLVDQTISKTILVCDDSGAADAYVLAPANIESAPDAYSTAMIIIFTPDNINTGASTVNVSGLGLKNLVTSTGAALPAGFIQTNVLYEFIYIFGQFVFMFHTGQLQATDFPDSIITNAMIADETIEIVKLADDTPHKIIGFDSLGVATTLSNPLRLLADTACTATASIAFVLSTLDTQDTKNSYLVQLKGIQPATDDLNLYMTLSSDGGATYAATNYAYLCTGYDTGLAALRSIAAAAGTEIVISGTTDATRSWSNASDEVGTVNLWITNINTNSNVVPIIESNSSFYNANSQMTRMSGSASRTTAADYDAIKFTWEGGANFAAVGRIVVYKICNTLA